MGGAPVAAIAAVLVAVAIAKRSADSESNATSDALTPAPLHEFEVRFSNPSVGVVHLFDVPNGGGPQKIFTLKPGEGASRLTRAGSRFFFSPQKSGNRPVHTVEVDPNLLEYRYNPDCKNLHDAAGCEKFRSWGSCAQNPGWMSVNCAFTCNTCHLVDPKVRCSAARLNMTLEPAAAPGDIKSMFTSLEERFPNYGVKLLSAEPDGPYVATFDTFVTAEESRIVRQLTETTLIRSTDQGDIDPNTGIQAKITSTGRTSSNSWCDENNGCAAHPVVKNLLRKISDVVQISEPHFENMQVLQYNIGQFYNIHHDAGASDFKILSGPRLYTMFLYFDDVEEGGGTNFPLLNLTVEPSKGKALLWPSLHNEDPMKVDKRTSHQALPVVKGKKLAANVWVRQRNYKLPNLWGCTGSFADG